MLFQLIKNLYVILVVAAVSGCTGTSAQPEAVTVQTVDLLVVERASPLIEGPVSAFNAAQPTYSVDVETVPAEDAVALFCRGNVSLILLARTLTDAEDAQCHANDYSRVAFFVASSDEHKFIMLAHEAAVIPVSPTATFLAFLFTSEELPLAIEQAGLNAAPTGTYQENLGTLQILLERDE